MGPCWLSILAPRRLQQSLHIINGWGSLCLLFSSLSKRFVKGSLLSLCNYVSERKVIFRLTDLENCWGESWREGMVREFGMDMYTLLYLKWITNRDLLCSIWNSAKCYVAAWMAGASGGEWIMYMYGRVPSLFTGNCHNIVNRFYPDVSAYKDPTSNTGHKQEMWTQSLGQ